MSYAIEHAAALQELKQAGGSIVFTTEHPGTEQPDGTFLGRASDTVLGYATEQDGDPEAYAGLGLVAGEAPRLFVVSEVYGATPSLNQRALWGGQQYTVRSVKPYRPDGTALFSYVILSR